MENFNEPKAIETIYRGIRFRSRLEARWAVFFDALNIKWEYEPEGFRLKNGEKYLPDFRLHWFCGRGPELEEHEDHILWCEVKGVTDEHDLMTRKRHDWEKTIELSNIGYVSNGYIEMFLRPNPIIILPNIPEDPSEWWNMEVSMFDSVDGDHWPCIITKPDLDDERFVLCGPDGNSYPEGDEYENTNMALRAARSKRFEFSEADLTPLENEVEVLRRRVELEEEKRQLLKKIQGGN